MYLLRFPLLGDFQNPQLLAMLLYAFFSSFFFFNFLPACILDFTEQ